MGGERDGSGDIGADLTATAGQIRSVLPGRPQKDLMARAARRVTGAAQSRTRYHHDLRWNPCGRSAR